jgi:hypothetical protein
MARTSAKTVERMASVAGARFGEVGISGLFFFGSFLLEEQKK